MKNATLKSTAPRRLPKLAATALFFLGLSTNTPLDAATPWVMEPVKVQQTPAQIAAQARAPVRTEAGMSGKDDGNGIHILSVHDEALYRSAFEAQERADWQTADAALAQIKDRRLIGYVLADRYNRRDMTLPEAKSWMVSFADHPQAQSLFNRARRLAGFKTAAVPQPARAATWNGHDGIEIPTGFRASAGDRSPNVARVAAKINAQIRQGDPMAARELLATEIQRGALSAHEAQDIAATIAAALFYDGQVERARPMARQAAEAGATLGLWIDGLASWKQRDDAEALASFGKLAHAEDLTSWDRAAAAYWAYRAANRSHNDAAAKQWLAEAAKAPRSFYGFMAANQLGKKTDTSWKIPELTARHIALLSQKPEGARALALVQIGKNDLANDELRRMNMSGRKETQAAMLALAEKAHLASLSLQLSGLVPGENGQRYDAAQYPVPGWQPTGGFKVDRALLYALIKRESKFDPSVVSQSGACGLMQIMPSTARRILNDNKKPTNGCPASLLDPATNMALGQKYVRVLADQPQIGDNLLLLLAAYNGGPGNVARWTDGSDRKDPLLFVESLPLRETRDYVQHVMVHYWMYRSRLAQPESSVAQLARGEWPRYAANDSAPRTLKLAANEAR